jgi:hypothetical protein
MRVERVSSSANSTHGAAGGHFETFDHGERVPVSCHSRFEVMSQRAKTSAHDKALIFVKIAMQR